MKQHKWHKEIKAWENGADIEMKVTETTGNAEQGWTMKTQWVHVCNPDFDNKDFIFRIKPQPKENEIEHTRYWLCCGSLNPHKHSKSCSEAKIGYRERCRFGTVAEHNIYNIEEHIKTQYKEPQYLYVVKDMYGSDLFITESIKHKSDWVKYIGKIKLEE